MAKKIAAAGVFEHTYKKKDGSEATGKFTVTKGWKQAKVMQQVVTPEELLADAERMKYLVEHLCSAGSSSFVKEIFD